MKLILTAALAWNAASVTADEFLTQYRYRPFLGTMAPDSVSSYSSPATNLPPLRIFQRGATTDAFQDLWYGEFGPEKYYICGSDILSNVLSDDFTVIAFLRFRSVASSQTICSTLTTGSPEEGFRLSVTDGILKGEVWFNLADDGRVLRMIQSTSPLLTNRWYRLALQLGQGGGSQLMRLWIDSEIVASLQLSDEGDAAHSSLAPIFGADRDTVNGVLLADVQAIQLDDYALSEFFLESKIIRDASSYFGIPAYHDYIGNGTVTVTNGKRRGEPLERRIHNTWTNPNFSSFRSRVAGGWPESTKGTYFVPFANDEYIPQGVASDEENGRVFLSMYFGRELDGGNPNNYPSIVVEIFLPEERLGNIFMLYTASFAPMTAHVGGLAYWSGRLIVPNANDLLIYDISSASPSNFDPATMSGFSPAPITPVETMENIVSFDSIAFIDLSLDFANEPYIYLGDFDHDTRRTVDVFHIREANGTLSFISANSFLEGSKDAQGVGVFYRSGLLLKVMLSTSYSSGYSTLYSTSYTNGLQQSHSVVTSGPSGFEDLAFFRGAVWTVSESGAKYYQKRPSAPWPQLFPFLFGLNVTDLTDENSNTLPDQWEARYSLPNLTASDVLQDQDSDGVLTWGEYVADTNPFDAQSRPHLTISISKEPLELRAMTSRARFYAVEGTVDFKTWETLSLLGSARGNGGMAQWPVSKGGSKMFYQFRVKLW